MILAVLTVTFSTGLLAQDIRFEQGMDTSCVIPQLIDVVHSGKIRKVESLLKKGSDVNLAMKDGWTALSEAAFTGQLDMAKLLIEKGATVDAVADYCKITPLMIAAIQGYSEIVELLIAKGANVNAKDRSGRTPLQYAYSLRRQGVSNASTVDIIKKNGGTIGWKGFGGCNIMISSCL
jgi:hypothetical protein